MTFVPTDEQRDILNHDFEQDGVILAGPGTGKSATVVAYIEQLAERDRAPRVRLLTFTRAATAELARRVSSHPSIAAERPSTIHSFAISVLLRNIGCADFPSPLRMADDWESDVVVRSTLARRSGIGLRTLSVLLREMEANWQSLTPNDDPRIAPAVRTRFLGVWLEHRRVYGYTLLSELPNLFRQALVDHPELDGLDYDLLVVDEYQDLNACDLEVLRRLGTRGCSILAAGDDDQSIYSFRKAAPEGIRRFAADYPGSSTYPLSVSKRCGRRIIEWARFVIEVDPDRPSRPALTADAGAVDGEVALLAFDDNAAEAAGIAQIVRQLVEIEHVAPADILVLFRGDRAGLFSTPIKAHLSEIGIAVSDPDAVRRALAEVRNRWSFEVLRLLSDSADSLAWAALLSLTKGVGEGFVAHIYDVARSERLGFGVALLREHAGGFTGAPRSAAGKARATIDDVVRWLAEHSLPGERPANGWGHWAVSLPTNGIFPGLSEDLASVLCDLDELTDVTDEFGRYLNQVGPLGSDLAAAKSDGVRFMTMAASKGLTVRATIVAALEDGIMPRPEADLAEERRLLYVAMTRAKEYVFCTWARRRTGPTARSGAPNVGQYRHHSPFLSSGPVASQSGVNYFQRWR